MSACGRAGRKALPEKAFAKSPYLQRRKYRPSNHRSEREAVGLKNKAEKWRSAGLITAEQEKALLHYEKSSKKSAGWGLYGFLLVAVFSAGLGVIALIAANWRIIPAGWKLAGWFTLLAGTGAGALKLKRENTSDFWFSALLVLFMILCLAGIGLISQIYNIQGESYSALLLWCFITSGLVFFSRTGLPTHLWIAGLYSAIATWGVQSLNEVFFNKTALLHPLGFFFILTILHNKKLEGYLPGLRAKRKALLEWTLISGAVSLFFFHVPPGEGFRIAGPDFVFSALAGGAVFAAGRFSDFKKIQKNLLAGLWILFFLFYLGVFPTQPNSLILMIFSVLVLSLIALFFAVSRQKSWFLFFTTALVFRILFFYITVFKSLTVTGLILILLSLVVFSAVQTAKKHRKKLLQWIEGLE